MEESDSSPNFCFVLKVKVQYSSKMNKEMEYREGSQGQTRAGSGVLKGMG